MIMVVKVEVFAAEPPCPGCLHLLEMADQIKAKYGDRIEVIKHMGLMRSLRSTS